jgi:cation diffusion facilitator family transporter
LELDPERVHVHVFDARNPVAERRTRQVMWLTIVMMVIEIAAGTVLGSMALLADGWHMSSHALALGVSAGAYYLARRHSDDPRFSFGTWKIEVLGGYTSAVFLLGVAAYMGIESVTRLVRPTSILYGEAIAVAVLGLAVNLVSAWLLGGGHRAHTHERAEDLVASLTSAGHAGHVHGAHGHHHDLNLRSAYLHVMADAATSVLAIVALLAGKFWGASWLDPVMGLVGALLVALWARGLLRDTGRVLLDAEMDAPVVEEIREVVAQLPVPARITDLHVWRVGKAQYACILGLATSSALSADSVRQALGVHEELAHITVEVNHLA